jgi:hypothetical protein
MKKPVHLGVRMAKHALSYDGLLIVRACDTTIRTKSPLTYSLDAVTCRACQRTYAFQEGMGLVRAEVRS